MHADLAGPLTAPGASAPETGGSTARAASQPEQGGSTARAAAGIPAAACRTGPDTGAAACGAALAPIVSGHPDRAALDQLTIVVPEAITHRQRPRSGAGGAIPPLTGQTRQRRQDTPLHRPTGLLSRPHRAGRRPAPPAPQRRPFHQLAPAPGPGPHHPGPSRPTCARAVTARDKHCTFPGCIPRSAKPTMSA